MILERPWVRLLTAIARTACSRITHVNEIGGQDEYPVSAEVRPPATRNHWTDSWDIPQPQRT